MKKMINFLRKLFGYNPECKCESVHNSECTCEPECKCEPSPVLTEVEQPTEVVKEEVKEAPAKKKRAPRRKKVTAEKK